MYSFFERQLVNTASLGEKKYCLATEFGAHGKISSYHYGFSAGHLGVNALVCAIRLKYQLELLYV